MLLAERVGKKQREMGAMNYADYIIIGVAQALALFPGVSRSGITISAGLFRNLDRAGAARFSFLLSTPIIFAAGLKQLKDVAETGLPSGEILTFAVGFVVAAISGYLAIRFLMSYLKKGSLKVFAAYRFILAAAILATFLRF
jgi:undecaprenyl-diphosphatase